jgi:hypothetical protein
MHQSEAKINKYQQIQLLRNFHSKPKVVVTGAMALMA